MYTRLFSGVLIQGEKSYRKQGLSLCPDFIHKCPSRGIPNIIFVQGKRLVYNMPIFLKVHAKEEGLVPRLFWD